MSVKNADLSDLISLTLADLPDQEFDVAWDNQDYEFTRIYQTERMEIDGGESIVRKVLLDTTGNAKYCRPFETDEPTVGDVMHTITVPWTQLKTSYSWDKIELLRNKNNVKGFIKLIKVRRIDGLLPLANLIEDRAWKSPTSATDDLYPYGVPYYINHMTKGTTTDGFVGYTIRYQDATTGVVCAGINGDNEAKWRNWAALYASIDAAMLKKFRLAFMYTKFKAPLNVTDPSNPSVAAKRIYADFNTVAELQELCDAKADDHSGKEVLGNITMDATGLVYLNRLPVVPIPQLNSYTDPEIGTATAPIYCVDFRKFQPFVHEGYWMVETEPMTDRGQHTTFTIFLDGAHNNLLLNRREAGFVLHKAIPAA